MPNSSLAEFNQFKDICLAMQNLRNDLRAELLSQRNWDSKVPFIILITRVQGFQVEPDGNSDMVMANDMYEGKCC